MLAVEISSFGPPDVLTPVDRPRPVANDNEVLIRVEAAGVARADLMQRQGKYPPPPGASPILGLECAGEVMEVAADIDAAKQLVIERNGKPDAYVRPVAFRGSEMMGVSAQTNKIHLAIATWEWPSYFDPAQRLKGIRLDLAEYRRPDPKTAPCLAKAAGLYMICTVSKHRAEKRGYADAMMLDWQGRVAECTGANIFFIKDGKIHTPIADCFLAGITRATAMNLAKQNGIEVIERRIMPEEFSGFSECFITGTAAEVTAVSEIADWKFTPGRITQTLMSDYTAEVQPKGKQAAA